MKNLICWCCGAGFTGLQDVNHDDGYWLCIDCTREQEQDNENQYEEIFKMIYDWWSDKTKNVIDTRIKEMWKEQARNIVVNMWLEKWRVKRTF